MAAEPGLTDGEGQQEGISVVYVDDYEELCELTAEGLEDASSRISVTTANDPAVVTGRLDEFDCIVADYAMPDIDGLELLRQVRNRDERIPFILYTGKGSEDIASEAISLDVTDYLAKRGGPERFVRLAHRIENVVDANRAAEVVERTRKQAQATVERERARFQALIERSPAMTVVLDAEGNLEYLSPSAEDVTGYEPRELRGESGFEYVHPEDREQVYREFERGLENPDYRPSAEYRFGHADGRWIHFESRGVNRLDDPAVEGFVVNTRDVTDRNRTERRLEHERHLSERMLEITPAPTLVVGDGGKVLRANRHAAEVFGMRRSELTRSSAGDFDASVVDPGDGVAPGTEYLGSVAAASGQELHGVEYEVSVPAGRLRLVVNSALVTETERRAVVVSVDEVDPLPVDDDNNT
jgi:PAS domain S-box-containing protein